MSNGSLEELLYFFFKSKKKKNDYSLILKNIGSLGQNQISDNGAKALGSSLIKNKKLHNLLFHFIFYLFFS